MFYLNFYLSPHLALALSFHELQSSSNALCWYTFRCKHVNITGPLSKVRKHFLFLALFTLVKGLFAPSYIKWAHNNPGWSFFFFLFVFPEAFTCRAMMVKHTHTHVHNSLTHPKQICLQEMSAPRNHSAQPIGKTFVHCIFHRKDW